MCEEARSPGVRWSLKSPTLLNTVNTFVRPETLARRMGVRTVGFFLL